VTKPRRARRTGAGAVDALHVEMRKGQYDRSVRSPVGARHRYEANASWRAMEGRRRGRLAGPALCQPRRPS
jgi:hypothetical protein